MRTIEEVRQHFLDYLKHALSHPSMYGGEAFIRNALFHISFIDNAEEILDREMAALEETGASNARGVAGAFFHETGIFDSGSGEVASIFAETAFRLAYLKLDRTLPRDSYERLKAGLREKYAVRDWTVDEVKGEFGQPSWSSGSNPFYPWAFAYACDDLNAAWTFFDFWNEVVVSKDNHVVGKYGPVPLLRNIRMPAATFRESFVFTPFGTRLTAKDIRKLKKRR